MALSNNPVQCFAIVNIMHCCHGRLCHMAILTDLIALLKIFRYIVLIPSRRSRSTSAGFPSHVLGALFVLA